MRPTKKTQPLRRGLPRKPSSALAAAMRGATGFGLNPMDTQRALEKQASGRKKSALGGKLQAAGAEPTVRRSEKKQRIPRMGKRMRAR